MPEVKQSADVYLVNYFCDECKSGHLIFTGRRREAAIKRGTFFNIHRCNKCGLVKEFEGKVYPATAFEVRLINNVKKPTGKDKKNPSG